MVVKKIMSWLGKYAGFRVSPGAQVLYNTFVMLMLVPVLTLSFIGIPLTFPLVLFFGTIFAMYGVFAMIGLIRLFNKYIQKISRDDVLKASTIVGALWILYAIFSGALAMTMGAPSILPIIFFGILLVLFIRYSGIEFEKPTV